MAGIAVTIGVIIFIMAIFAVSAVIFIWALNQLFGLNIKYSILNIIAALVIIALFSWRTYK